MDNGLLQSPSVCLDGAAAGPFLDIIVCFSFVLFFFHVSREIGIRGGSRFFDYIPTVLVSVIWSSFLNTYARNRSKTKSRLDLTPTAFSLPSGHKVKSKPNNDRSEVCLRFHNVYYDEMDTSKSATNDIVEHFFFFFSDKLVEFLFSKRLTICNITFRDSFYAPRRYIAVISCTR